MGDHHHHHMSVNVKAKPIARIDLESLYQGIPDQSVNLTFQDLPHQVINVNNNKNNNASSQPESQSQSQPTIIATIEIQPNIISHQLISNPTKPKPPSPSPSPAKIPNIDFNKGLQHASNQHQHQHHHLHDNHYGHHRQDFSHGGDAQWGHSGHFSHASEHHGARCSVGYDDDDMISVVSGRGGPPRRPGIPHSNICTVCSTYVYLFRTRCLVCGRVYCRQCVEIGMGEMIEGRKCIECLGLRFSKR